MSVRITMIGVSVELALAELNVLLSDNFISNFPVESDYKTNGTIWFNV
jgi:hypothetical protein